jgi:hypothetical protein
VLAAGYDSGGAHVWSEAFGGDGDHEARGIAIDLAGNVIVCGSFSGILDVGEQRLESLGMSDGFVAKVGPTGEPMWGMRFGGLSDDSAAGVAVDASGDIYVAAVSARVAEGADPMVPQPLSDDLLLVRISPEGVTRWTRTQGSTGEERALAIAVGGRGKIAVAGSFTDSTTMGGAWLESAGGRDGFVAVYGLAGNPLWSVRLGGFGDDAVTAAAFDGQDRLIVGGRFTGGVQLGAVTRVSAGGHDMFLAAFAPGPQVAWSRSIGGTGEEELAGLAAATDGSIAVAGSFSGALTVGTRELAPAGGYDGVVLRLRADGQPVWSRAIGGSGDDAATGVAFRPDGGVAAVGWFQGRVLFGGARVDSFGGRDLFLVSLSR